MFASYRAGRRGAAVIAPISTYLQRATCFTELTLRRLRRRGFRTLRRRFHHVTRRLMFPMSLCVFETLEIFYSRNILLCCPDDCVLLRWKKQNGVGLEAVFVDGFGVRSNEAAERRRRNQARRGGSYDAVRGLGFSASQNVLDFINTT